MPEDPTRARPLTPVDDGVAPVPEGNRPGHHPPVEQDKPTGPPPTPMAWKPGTHQFGFRFGRSVAPVSALFGVLPQTTQVTVTDDELDVRFGLWRLRTPLANVESVEQTGPYSWPKVAGPAHLSLADHGITFATTTEGGVCLRFREPVSAIAPGGWLRHPGATITVDDPERFASLVEERARRAAA